MSTKKLSVIMPVFNSEIYLERSIESILAQTMSDFNFFIINDGSTDNSHAIIERAAEKDERITLVSRKNLGIGRTLNELILTADSEFIARMDADDVAEKDRLEKQLSHIIGNNECVMVGGQINFIGTKRSLSARKFPIEHENIVSDLLRMRFSICHPTIMFRRSCAIEIGGYKDERVGEDLDFFLRMSEKGKIENSSSRVLNYRIHHNSTSIQNISKLHHSYRLSIINYRRRKGLLPPLSDHDLHGSNYFNNIFSRMQSKMSCYSEKMYRIGLFNAVSGVTSVGYFYFLVAAFSNPIRLYHRVRNHRV